MLDLPLTVLRILGLHPTDSSSLFAQIEAVIAIIASVVVAVTSLKEMCVVEWDIASVAPEVETLMASCQVLLEKKLLT